jgi:hypothetical protein
MKKYPNTWSIITERGRRGEQMKQTMSRFDSTIEKALHDAFGEGEVSRVFSLHQYRKKGLCIEWGGERSIVIRIDTNKRDAAMESVCHIIRPALEAVHFQGYVEILEWRHIGRNTYFREKEMNIGCEAEHGTVLLRSFEASVERELPDTHYLSSVDVRKEVHMEKGCVVLRRSHRTLYRFYTLEDVEGFLSFVHSREKEVRDAQERVMSWFLSLVGVADYSDRGEFVVGKKKIPFRIRGTLEDFRIRLNGKSFRSESVEGAVALSKKRLEPLAKKEKIRSML